MRLFRVSQEWEKFLQIEIKDTFDRLVHNLCTMYARSDYYSHFFLIFFKLHCNANISAKVESVTVTATNKEAPNFSWENLVRTKR